jgi:hypothetical protein
LDCVFSHSELLYHYIKRIKKGLGKHGREIPGLT